MTGKVKATTLRFMALKKSKLSLADKRALNAAADIIADLDTKLSGVHELESRLKDKTERLDSISARYEKRGERIEWFERQEADLNNQIRTISDEHQAAIERKEDALKTVNSQSIEIANLRKEVEGLKHDVRMAEANFNTADHNLKLTVQARDARDETIKELRAVIKDYFTDARSQARSEEDILAEGVMRGMERAMKFQHETYSDRLKKVTDNALKMSVGSFSDFSKKVAQGVASGVGVSKDQLNEIRPVSEGDLKTVLEQLKGRHSGE